MKKIIASMLLISTASFAQIQIKSETETIKRVLIGKYKTSSVNIGEMNYSILDQDTLIVITYKNEKYQTLNDYKSIIFKATPIELNSVYELMKSFWNEENKGNKEYKKEVMLGKTNVSISKTKIFGIKCISLFTAEGYFTMTVKNIDELFGKK
jgi:hypothetical protein